ncbi:MAG: cadmium-translocating P-type ATPase, partial [Clostridiales bacterium]|nr:cadmium-translocating P-type ATPase [Clostridiales bacterium]
MSCSCEHAVEQAEHGGCSCGCGQEAQSGHGQETGGSRREMIQLLAGAVLFGVSFFLPEGLWRSAGFLAAYLIVGWEVLLCAVRNIGKGKVFDENFLMVVATVGAFAIQEFAEGAAVMLFFQTGEFFQGLAVRRSRRSISDLMDIRPDSATVREDGVPRTVEPQAVRPGMLILVKPGEKVPLDGVVRAGTSSLDTSALTGESLPREVGQGAEILSGCVNLNGTLTVEVTADYGASTVSKILELVEHAGSRKSQTEQFITRFARYYTPAVVGLAALIAVVPSLFTGAWSTWVYRGLSFLVVSCPCALVISIPLGFFGGIGGASRAGVLVKGGNYLEVLAKSTTMVFDKTGTLTEGKFAITQILPAAGEGEAAEQKLLEIAAHCEAYSTHPISAAIRSAYGAEPDHEKLSGVKELAGRGLQAEYDATQYYVGNAALMETAGIDYAPVDAPGTVVYVASEDAYLGALLIQDRIKPDAKEGLRRLRRAGISRMVMLTGDSRSTGEQVARELELDAAYTQMLPDGKVEQVQKLLERQKDGEYLAFVGDGINDAPVLALADVGIA